MMKIVPLLSIIFVYLNFTKSDISVDLLKSFIEYYGKTAIISQFSCNKTESLILFEELSKDLHRINILPIEVKSFFHQFPPNSVIYIADLTCHNADKLINFANSAQLFASPYKWLLFTTNSNQIVPNFPDKPQIFVDSDVTIASKTIDDLWQLSKIFRRHNSTPIEFETMGNWSNRLIINQRFDRITSRRRKNLKKITLNTCIVITHNESLKHLTDKRDIHIDSIAKVNYVLVEHLSDIINVDLNYSIQSTWGYKDAKSNWNGMIGELVRKEADIGGTALFLTVDRIDIIDYIAMTTTTRSKFIFREPKLSYITNVFVLPFDKYVWMCTFLLLLVVAIVLYITIKWEKTLKKHNILEEVEMYDSWIEIVFITLGALCQQGTTRTPSSYPGRIIWIFLFLSLMFLYTSYSANIVALLQSSSTSIQTLEDLLKSRLDVGVDDTVFNHFYFPNATEPIRQALYRQKVAPPNQRPKFYPIEDGIKRLQQGLFAFHVETGPGYKLIGETFEENEKCGLQEIQYLQVTDPWLAIQKNSSYKKMLKVGLHQIEESGIQIREIGLIYTKKPQCLSRGSTFVNVGIVDCYPAIVVLFGGFAVAIVVFLLEIYVNYRVAFYARRRRRTNFLNKLGKKAGQSRFSYIE